MDSHRRHGATETKRKRDGGKERKSDALAMRSLLIFLFLPLCLCASVANGLSHQIFENARRAHSAADAHCDHSVASLAALHLVKQRGRQFRARAAERVAERDRAAVDVQPFEIEVQFLNDRQSLRGEGLVEFY